MEFIIVRSTHIKDRSRITNFMERARKKGTTMFSRESIEMEFDNKVN